MSFVRSFLVVGCLFLGLVAPAAGAEPFTLEQIMGSPFPSGLVASPVGDKVAWVFNHKGQRDIWVSSSPDYVGGPVTDLTADDGQEIGALAWSPDGLFLAFVRGGPPNSAGELPNPVGDPSGVERSVWVVRIRDSLMRRIDEGSSPLFMADGRHLAYIKEGKVWLSEVGSFEGGSVALPSQLIEGRGTFGSLRLSPDGRRLAFVSDRGSHSFVGIYDFRQDQLSYLDASVDRDTSPVWSPDGSRVAFVRLPARVGPTSIFTALREGTPWSIRLIDLESEAHEGFELWRAVHGPGSVFRGLVADRQLFWTRDDSLIFPWELDGWTHLYTIPAAGGPPRLLTPGAFEVEAVSMAPDRSYVVFSSNEDDIDRRHLWRVRPGDLRPTPLTRGESIEQSPVVVGDGSVIFLSSDGKRPLEPAILSDGEVRRLASSLQSPGFPTDSLVEPRQVLFPAADGMTIHGQLFEPPPEYIGQRPALVFFHGGSRRQMLLGWHYSSYYHKCYAFNQFMASRGFVVLSVNYRSGIGYGLGFREAQGYGASGASEFQDVLGAGLFLRSMPRVDGGAIAAWGGSYGGYLTALALARASDLYAAGVDVHGVHDWRRTIKNFVPSYNPLEDPESARVAFEASPLASVDTWRSPVLLVHGDDDRNVPFLETIELVQKLREQAVEIEMLVLPDEVHGFLVHRHWLEVFERASEFLLRRLGGQEPETSD